MYIPLDAIFFTLAFDYLIKFKSSMSEFGFYNSLNNFVDRLETPEHQWSSDYQRLHRPIRINAHYLHPRLI